MSGGHAAARSYRRAVMLQGFAYCFQRPDLLADVALSAASGGAAGEWMLQAGGLRRMYQRKEQPRGGSPGRHDTETRKKSYRKGEFDYEDTKDEEL